VQELSTETAVISDNTRLFLTAGMMGGLTTYSTFNYETMEYLREGAYWLAGLNVAAPLLLCLLAGVLGLAPARWLAGNPLRVHSAVQLTSAVTVPRVVTTNVFSSPTRADSTAAMDDARPTDSGRKICTTRRGAGRRC